MEYVFAITDTNIIYKANIRIYYLFDKYTIYIVLSKTI